MNAPPVPGVSKNAQKREWKQQKYNALKHMKKNLKKLQKIEKRKASEITAANAHTQIHTTNNTIGVNTETGEGKKNKHRKLNPAEVKKRSEEQPVIAIDCGFNSLQNEKEIKSLAQQIMLSYGANNRSEKPVRLAVTGLEGQLQESLSKLCGFERWNLHQKESKQVEDLYKSEEVVYLTADATESIESFDKETVYVIGGLVDRNRHKGICMNKATEQQYRAKRLPIDEFLTLDGSRILTVNQVFCIILEYLCKNDWKEAFSSIVPKRKVVPNEEEGNASANIAISNPLTNENTEKMGLAATNSENMDSSTISPKPEVQPNTDTDTNVKTECVNEDTSIVEPRPVTQSSSDTPSNENFV